MSERGSNTTQCTMYGDMMRKFSESRKERCRSGSVPLPHMARYTKEFPTGSEYEGTWGVLGMSGFGTYTFPNGVTYSGGFEDGEFHGAGELEYPSGEVIKTQYHHGTMKERKLMFDDGLEYEENDWLYCQLPDRRYTTEYDLGLRPAGKSYITPEQPPRRIPRGYYDTGDGFYDPKTKMVYRYDDLHGILRSPQEREQQWIEDNCRRALDETVGPRPDLYEDWLEPDPEAAQPPPPAAMSRACMHMFQPESEEDEDMDDSDTDIMDHWQNVLEGSIDQSNTIGRVRHLKFKPSKDIQHLIQIFEKMKEDADKNEYPLYRK